MKAVCAEHNGCFCVDLHPENDKDISFLVRMPLGAKKQSTRITTYAGKEGDFLCSLIVAKVKNSRMSIGA